MPVRPDYERTWRLVFGAVALVTFVLLAAFLIPRLRDVLIIVFFAALIATAIRPTALAISRWRIPPFGVHLPIEIAVLLIYLGVLIVLTLLGLFIVPQLLAQMRDLAGQVPAFAATATEMLRRFAESPLFPAPREVEGALQEQIIANLARVFDVLRFIIGVIGGILSALLVAVIALFLVRDADRLVDHFVGILPEDSHDKACHVLALASRKVRGWALGTLLLALFVGSTTVAGLLLIGMPYAFVLGLAMAIAELIPLVGPYLGALPALLIALTMSFETFLLVAGLYLLIQQIENNLLGPWIMGSQAHIPPLLVIIALLVGAALLGIIGALLAVPAAAILQVIWLEVVVPWIKGVERYWGVDQKSA
jgi:predicted PurR-regulated permease PerM